MELINAIQKRRAVREYSKTPVLREDIGRFITAANLAPSAMNRQPWAFAVVMDRDRIRAYGASAKAWLLENYKATQFGPELLKLVEPEVYHIFHDAPALIVVYAKSEDPQACEDCCLAAENLMLAAYAEGVGSCCIGLARPWLNLPSTKREFGVPESFHAVVPIVLGNPVHWPAQTERHTPEIYWVG